MAYMQFNLAYYEETPRGFDGSFIVREREYAYAETVYTPRKADRGNS